MADKFVSLPGEIWKPVLGKPHYQVSNLGRVRSSNGLLKGYLHHDPKGRLAALTVSLDRRVKARKRREAKIHVLVLEAFVGPRPPKMDGCHYDGDPTNNKLCNLRWDTRRGNVQDAIRHGTHSPPPTLYGERNGFAKLSDAQRAYIKSMPLARGSKKSLARRFNVDQGTIDKVMGRPRLYKKLTIFEAKKILAAIHSGVTGRQLARQFGVSESTISAVKRGTRGWGNL